jgi:hypothetical protein
LVVVTHLILEEQIVELDLLQAPLLIHEEHVLILVIGIHGVVMIVLLFELLHSILQLKVVVLLHLWCKGGRVIQLWFLLLLWQLILLQVLIRWCIDLVCIRCLILWRLLMLH